VKTAFDYIRLLHSIIEHCKEVLIAVLIDCQVKMLQALGMKSTLITDGSSPINLFTTATGLVGNMVARRGTRNTDDDDE